MQVKGVLSSVSREEEDGFVDATSSCQDLYLSAVLARVIDAVNTVFSGGNKPLPTAAELHRYIG